MTIKTILVSTLYLMMQSCNVFAEFVSEPTSSTVSSDGSSSAISGLSSLISSLGIYGLIPGGFIVLLMFWINGKINSTKNITTRSNNYNVDKKTIGTQINAELKQDKQVAVEVQKDKAVAQVEQNKVSDIIDKANAQLANDLEIDKKPETNEEVTSEIKEITTKW